MNRIGTRTIVTALLALSLVTGPAAMLQPAFAHVHATLTLEDDPVEGSQISMVLGHANEPTYGAKPGIHDGKHGLEISLSDAATELPLAGASLQADKYYFKDIRSFERAESPEDADAIEEGVDVGGAFGEDGQYLARQVLKPGIYGYRVYGTIDYFGVSSVSIDTTVFCSSPEGNTTKFNSPEWGGSFGCTQDISDSIFPARPGKGHDSSSSDREHDAGSEMKGNEMTAATNTQYTVPEQQSTESRAWDFGGLLFSIPVAVLAGFLGWRSLRRRGDGQ